MMTIRKRKHYQITDRCRSCGLCREVCPMKAISMGEAHYEIDPGKCASCGSCFLRCPFHGVSEQ